MNKQFSKKEQKAYERICSLNCESALRVVTNILKQKYQDVISTPAYTIALGDIPIAILAHADTVFTSPPKNFFYDREQNVMWSPEGMGADDRAGLYAIIQILKTNLRPHIIITTGEERGGIGANKIAAHYPMFPDELKFMVQLDRRGSNDSVYYDCGNDDFEKFINNFGFETAWGTFTDISILAPRWGVAAVNLSIGYEDEHNPIERLYVGAMYSTIEKTIKIIEYVRDNPEMKPFEYIDAYPSLYFKNSKNGYYYNWDFDEDEDYWNIPKNKTICGFCGKTVDKTNVLHVCLNKPDSVLELCDDCFSRCYQTIDWCSKCGKAWYLWDEDVANKYETTMKQNKPYKYICPACREKKNV